MEPVVFYINQATADAWLKQFGQLPRGVQTLPKLPVTFNPAEFLFSWSKFQAEVANGKKSN